MLKNCENLQQLWGGVSEIVDRWLRERQQLLTQFCALTEDKSFDGKNPVQGKQLQRFCQILVDYISAGHFEVYESLAEEGKRFSDRDGLERGADLLDIIQSTTELILDFNDKYLATDDLDLLASDLSALGETLETRFEAEDALIEALHSAHATQLNT